MGGALTKLSAFTLTEVLVVVTILAILAAIVLSATAKSRRLGHAATCTSNLRQAAQSLEMYLQDGDGALPTTLYHDFSPILPYPGDGKVLECPLVPYKLGANWQSTRATGKRTSLMAPLTISRSFMRHLPVLDPNHGVFVCLVHGQRDSLDPNPDPVNGYEGLVLPARKDTSVERRRVNRRCYRDDDGTMEGGRMYRDLFTDEPMPLDVQIFLTTIPDAREVPCPDSGAPR